MSSDVARTDHLRERPTQPVGHPPERAHGLGRQVARPVREARRVPEDVAERHHLSEELAELGEHALVDLVDRQERVQQDDLRVRTVPASSGTGTTSRVRVSSVTAPR